MKQIFNECVSNLETYIMFKIGEEVARIRPELEAKGRAPISLTLGAPVARPPEFVVDKLKEYLDADNIHTYSSPRGEKKFLEAIAERMKRRFGVEIDPTCEIFSLIGAKEGIANLFRAILNSTTVDKDKEIILIPDPGYASYKEMIKVSGGKAYPIPLTLENNYMPNLEEVWENLKKDGLDEGKVKAVVLNYPNNPLGATANLEYFEKAVEFAKKHEILLISDAAYTDLYFDEDDVPPSVFQVEGAKDVAVEFFTMSKPYAMTGWRLGWICGNKEVIKHFGKQKTTIDTGIFKALQLASADILLAKEGDEYIKKANAEFKRKQELALDGLRELGWDFDAFQAPKATFYLWLPIPPRYKTSEEFTNDLMYTSGVVLVPGSACGKYGEGFFRISVVCKDETLFEMFDRMKKDGFYYNK
ncbi:aminotransferase class I/II-fold pyridoxal phosphate-dependent enzyme [bacterium]|nr:aminotransferase class I/II-fold pyridoxal phosphate-dependent enzyme [bacterium]